MGQPLLIECTSGVHCECVSTFLVECTFGVSTFFNADADVTEIFIDMEDAAKINIFRIRNKYKI